MNDRRFQINWHTSQIAAADSLIRGNAANSLRSLLDEQIRDHAAKLLPLLLWPGFMDEQKLYTSGYIFWCEPIVGVCFERCLTLDEAAAIGTSEVRQTAWGNVPGGES